MIYRFESFQIYLPWVDNFQQSKCMDMPLYGMDLIGPPMVESIKQISLMHLSLHIIRTLLSMGVRYLNLALSYLQYVLQSSKTNQSFHHN
mgnify:CR=1 FL=1